MQKRWGFAVLPIGVCVLATLMPISAILLCNLPKVALGNFTDAVFYLAYARQFSELVLRHGFIYYATRFGGIFPDAMAGHLFGEIDGIWILRWVLSSLVSLSLFLTFRKRYGVIAGVLASALWAFNPAALRLACTTYVDSTAVPFLILGCCLAANAPTRVTTLFLAGLLFGLASSAHLYAAFALVFLIPWLVSALWGEEWKGSARYIGWMMAGFALSWLLGWLWYVVVWGMPGLISPTIDLMRDLGNGQAALWKKPTALALHEAPAWFAPIALLPLCGMAAWKGSSLMLGAACSLLLATGFFWGGDIFGKAYVLSMPFYYSFLLPLTVLAAGAVCGEVAGRQTSGAARIVAGGLLALAFVLPTLMARWEITAWVVAAVAAASALTLILMRRKLAAAWLLAASLPLLFLASQAVARTGIFSQMLGHYATRDEPILEFASRLRGMLPSASSDQETTRFWYDDDFAKPGGSDRRMIGSFWLHYFGKLTGKDGDYIPFGTMDDATAEEIRENGPGRIVIFDQDPQKVTDACSVIRAKGLPYALSRKEKLVAGSDPRRTVQVAILERSMPTSEGSPSAKVFWHRMHRGRLLSSNTEGEEFVSSRIKCWDPFAEADLGRLRKGDKVVIPYTIRSGRIRFSLGERGKDPLVSLDKWPADHEAKLELTVPADMGDALVSLRNRYPAGAASQIKLGAVSVFKSVENP